VLVDRDGYEVFGLDDKMIDERSGGKTASSKDLQSIDAMTDDHFGNFIGGIRRGEGLRSPIAEGNISVTMLQLANIAWKVNRTLHLNASDAHILNDPDAMALWRREYEKGWELTI
jgi:hypothetical protein